MSEKQDPIVPQAWYWRLLLTMSFTLIPWLSFFLTGDGTLFGPEWQTGDWFDYIGLFFFNEVTRVFVPLLVYAAAAMVLLMISPNRFASFLLVRLGIYSGIILSLHYVLQIIIATAGVVLIMVVSSAVAFFGLRWLYMWRVEQAGLTQTWRWIGLIVVTWIGLATVMSFISIMVGNYFYGPLRDLVEWIYAPGVLLLAGWIGSGPFICLALSISVARKLWRRYDSTAQEQGWLFSSIAVWIVAYGLSWRAAVLRAMEAYAALPTHPPDCYIATAAAQGHPALVKSQTMITTDGREMQVNGQLQVFKAAELSLKLATPPLHRLLRRGYDGLGQPLARCLRYPLLADVAYLLLKPAEWSARLIMALVLPDAAIHIGRIYRP